MEVGVKKLKIVIAARKDGVTSQMIKMGKVSPRLTNCRSCIMLLLRVK